MLVGATVTAASVYRLAVFNLREDEGKDFIGMPTPANALFALGLWSWMGSWDNWEWIMALEGSQLLYGIGTGLQPFMLSTGKRFVPST